MFSFTLVVCLAGVFCLAPLTFYLLWLAVLNRRDRASVVGGGWDFAALLGGLSGFILFCGGLLLSLLQSNVRFGVRGNFVALRDAWDQEQVKWCAIVAAYLVVVVGGAALTFAARRRTLVIYNVEPAHFEATLAEVFDHLGRTVERRGNLWSGGGPLAEVEPFDAGRAVTLRWVSDDLRLFQDVERQLRETVPSLPAAENPNARWLMSAAVGCVALIVFFVVTLIYGLGFVRS